MGKRESIAHFNQLLEEKVLVGPILPSSLCDVIGFDFLSSRAAHIGFLKNDLNLVFHPDALNLAGQKSVLHRD